MYTCLVELLLINLDKYIKMKLSTISVIGFVTFFILGIVMGSFFNKAKELTKIEYVSLPSKDSLVYVTKLVREEIPSNPRYLTKIDTLVVHDTVTDTNTVVKYVESIDTLAIVQDWITRREYRELLFDDDTLGEFTANLTVQYNKLESINYTYKPRQRTVTTTTNHYKYKSPTFIPYVGTGYDFNQTVKARAGLYYHNLGFEYNYNLPLNGNSGYHGIGVNYKFR